MPARQRHEFPVAVREDALTRAAGRCEKVDAAGVRCPCRLQRHYYQFVHVIADALGGRPTLDNCRVWCTPCHRADFLRDMAVIAQTKRLEATEAGLAPAPSRPMPGSTFMRTSRGVDGRVRDRTTGLVLSHPASIDVRDL